MRGILGMQSVCLGHQQLTPECAVMEYLVQPSVSDVMNLHIWLDDSSSHIKRMEWYDIIDSELPAGRTVTVTFTELHTPQFSIIN